MAGVHKVKVGRVYDEPARGDGARVLVDRMWPRGLSKDKAHLDEWCTDVAPATTLREWYQHDPPWPRLPTTSMSAFVLASISTCAGCP